MVLSPLSKHIHPITLAAHRSSSVTPVLKSETSQHQEVAQQSFSHYSQKWSQRDGIAPYQASASSRAIHYPFLSSIFSWNRHCQYLETPERVELAVSSEAAQPIKGLTLTSVLSPTPYLYSWINLHFINRLRMMDMLTYSSKLGFKFFDNSQAEGHYTICLSDNDPSTVIHFISILTTHNTFDDETLHMLSRSIHWIRDTVDYVTISRERPKSRL